MGMWKYGGNHWFLLFIVRFLSSVVVNSKFALVSFIAAIETKKVFPFADVRARKSQGKNLLVSIFTVYRSETNRLLYIILFVK